MLNSKWKKRRRQITHKAFLEKEISGVKLMWCKWGIQNNFRMQTWYHAMVLVTLTSTLWASASWLPALQGNQACVTSVGCSRHAGFLPHLTLTMLSRPWLPPWHPPAPPASVGQPSCHPPGPRRSPDHYATSHWLGQLPPAAGLVPHSRTAILIGCWEGRPPYGSPGSWGGLVPAPTGWGWFATTGVGAPRGSWCQPPWQHLGTTWQTPTGHRVYLRRASTSSGASCQRRYPRASSDSQGYKHPLLLQFGLEKGWQRGVYE